MLFWFSALTLMADALEVVDMRVRQIAAGSGTSDEMFLMVTEKLDAASAAGSIIIRGGDCGQVLDHYRTIVAANVERLSARAREHRPLRPRLRCFEAEGSSGSHRRLNSK